MRVVVVLGLCFAAVFGRAESVLDPGGKVLGYHLDVSNGRVLRMEMMRRVVDILHALGYNHLQMNTEHTFAYSKHRAVWDGASPMTPDEVRELDAFCAERGIELCANQNSFGHLGRWLRLPEYNDLAESPKGGCHSRYRSKPMKAPMSLCPTDPRSIALIAGLYDELMPCFRSRWINVGLDETYELDDVTGTGRSASAIAAKGAERVYLEYFKKIYALVHDRGHKMMFWGDIILHKPELIPEIPEDVLCLNWGYSANFPFEEQTKRFADSKRRFLVCPGTRAWGTVSGNVPEMMSNIDRAVSAGERNGAEGYLLADWGDYGGLCPWIVSLPSVVYLSMKLKTPEVSRDSLIARIDEVAGCRCGAALLEYGTLYQSIGGRNNEVVNEYCAALRDGRHYVRRKDVTDEKLKAARESHAKAKALFDAEHAPRWMCDDFAFLDLVCTAAEDRIENPGQVNFRARFEPEYRRLWLTNSRPGGLEGSLNLNLGL